MIKVSVTDYFGQYLLNRAAAFKWSISQGSSLGVNKELQRCFNGDSKVETSAIQCG